MRIRYRPLTGGGATRNFRVLKVQPDHGDGVIRCELRYSSIHQAPPYRALSYTWGDPFEHGEKNSTTELEEVIVDGDPVNVSKSIATALRAMRDWHPGSTDFVWADAICIDQSNLKERGEQVDLMSQIYSLADSVFVWLGPSTDDSNDAIEMLEHLAEGRRGPDPREAVLARAGDLAQGSSWKALANFMERRWWTRAWILQESVLARRLEFACGKKMAQGRNIIEGFSAIEDYRDKVYNLLRDKQNVALNTHSGNVIDGMGRLRTARLDGTVYNMQTCHYRSMSAKATDPRDYVYGKLGLASDGHVVRPDYTKEVQEVYRDFVLGHIKATGSLDMIYFDARPRETPRLPTWVPDWHSSYGANFLIPEALASTFGEPHVSPSVVSADDGPASLELLGTRSALVVQVAFVDVIDGLGAGGEDGWQGVQARKPLSQSKESLSAYGDDAATFNALWRSMLANKDMDRGPTAAETGSILAATTAEDKLDEAVSGPRFKHYYSDMKELRFAGKTIEEWFQWARDTLPKIEYTLDQRIQAERSVVDSCYFRRMMTTDLGLVAVGPYEAEPGDHVCLAQGSSLPLILRPVDHASGSALSQEYVLRGAAYVHGFVPEALARYQGRRHYKSVRIV